MNRPERIARRLTDAADLAAEPLNRIPLVELLGEDRILIENHNGVCAYSDCQIGVKVGFGQVEITGSHLVIARMTAQQLIINGCIDRVELVKRR